MSKDKPMKNFLVRFPEDVLEAAKKKAGLIPLAAVIRRLVEKWLKGEIELED